MENIDWLKSVALPYANFFIFLFLAVKFFKKPLNAFAQQRKDKYDKFISEAQHLADKAKQESEEIQKRLNSLESDIANLKKSVLESAELEAKAIVDSARALASHISVESKRVAEVEVSNAKKNLQEEIIKVAKEQVAAKLRAELTEKDKQLKILHSKMDVLSNARM